MSHWNNNITALAAFYLSKGDYIQCIKYGTISMKGYPKIWNDESGGNVAIVLAKAKLLAGQLDSAEYMLDIVIKNNSNDTATFGQGYELLPIALQVKVLLKIKTGNLDEAEKIVIRCRELIDRYRIPAYAGAGIAAPDYYLALVRIALPSRVVR